MGITNSIIKSKSKSKECNQKKQMQIVTKKKLSKESIYMEKNASMDATIEIKNRNPSKKQLSSEKKKKSNRKEDPGNSVIVYEPLIQNQDNTRNSYENRNQYENRNSNNDAIYKFPKSEVFEYKITKEYTPEELCKIHDDLMNDHLDLAQSSSTCSLENSSLGESSSQMSEEQYGDLSLSALMWNMFSDRRIGDLYKFGDSFDNIFSIPMSSSSLSYARPYPESDYFARTYEQKPYICQEISCCEKRFNELLRQQDNFLATINAKCEVNGKLLKQITNLKNELTESTNLVESLQAEKVLERQYWRQRFCNERYNLVKANNDKVEQSRKESQEACKGIIEKLERINAILINTIESTFNELETAYRKLRILKKLFGNMRYKVENCPSQKPMSKHIQYLENLIKLKDETIRKQELTINRLQKQNKLRLHNFKKGYNHRKR